MHVYKQIYNIYTNIQSTSSKGKCFAQKEIGQRKKGVLKKNRACQYIWEISKVHFKGVLFIIFPDWICIYTSIVWSGGKVEGLESEEKRKKRKRGICG